MLAYSLIMSIIKSLLLSRRLCLRKYVLVESKHKELTLWNVVKNVFVCRCVQDLNFGARWGCKYNPNRFRDIMLSLLVPLGENVHNKRNCHSPIFEKPLLPAPGDSPSGKGEKSFQCTYWWKDVWFVVFWRCSQIDIGDVGPALVLLINCVSLPKTFTKMSLNTVLGNR